MAWPFNRKKNTEEVPAEVQEYYQAERRERTGIAWLLAVVTLVATLAIAAGLFYGGRWVYRQIAGNGDEPAVTEPTETETPEELPGVSGTTDDQTADDDSEPADSEEDEAEPETPTTTPRTGDTGELPSTGPSGDEPLL